MIKMWTVGLALLCVLLTTAAQISLKVGVSGPTMQSALVSGDNVRFLVRALLSPAVLLGLALYVLSTVVWLYVLARADVSFAYPFVSLGFVLVAAYAYFMLAEPMTLPRIAGIACIVAGVWLVSRS